MPITDANRLTALQSGEIDLLSSNTTWTMPCEAPMGLPRGRNALYTEGALNYAPPIR